MAEPLDEASPPTEPAGKLDTELGTRPNTEDSPTDAQHGDIDPDRRHRLEVARGDRRETHHLDEVRIMHLSYESWADRDPELAAALAYGDARFPDRVPPDGQRPPWQPEVDVDPETSEAFDRESRNGTVSALHQGAELLDEVHEQLTRYVAFPSPEAADAVTLYAAATHAQQAWEHATRLVVKSPVKRCGKTRLQEVLAELCYRVLKTTNISPAALARSIDDDDPPTIELDEADSVFATRRGERSEGAEDIRGILNAGHSRGWPYVRWDPAKRVREECPTFAMAVIGGIGDMPDTVEDRAVVLTMRRRAPGEHVHQFRRRRAVGPLRELRERLHDWVGRIVDDLAEAEPFLPVEDRAADVFEPLVAVADAAGGDWPERARRATKALAPSGDGDDSDSTRLLADIYEAFHGAEAISTATLLERLNALETSPWGGWHQGKGLSAINLAKMLKPYNIKPRTVRIDDETAKGYLAEWFGDVWSRYVPAYATQTRHTRHTRNTPASDVTGVTPVTGASSEKEETDSWPAQQSLPNASYADGASDPATSGDGSSSAPSPRVPDASLTGTTKSTDSSPVDSDSVTSEGAYRMARARRDAGQPLNELDQRVLQFYEGELGPLEEDPF